MDNAFVQWALGVAIATPLLALLSQVASWWHMKSSQKFRVAIQANFIAIILSSGLNLFLLQMLAHSSSTTVSLILMLGVITVTFWIFATTYAKHFREADESLISSKTALQITGNLAVLLAVSGTAFSLIAIFTKS